MNSKVYVENLAAATTESDLMDLFSVYGNVAEIQVSRDRVSGRSRGSGWVSMATTEGARSAIQALNGKAIGTGTLVVREAAPLEKRAGNPRRSFSCLY